jgi:phosphatidylglycerol:prolipoprotein diacylglycerol transferase
MSGTITIGIDPYVSLGPLTLAWHGIAIAVGLVVGALMAGRIVRGYGLSPEPLLTLAGLAGGGGIVGGRLLYLIEHGRLLEPAEWLSNRGFSFNGGFAVAAAAIAGYVWRRGLSLRYLDAVAVALPLGIAVGRIGDVINGEHYGPPTNFFLGVRNTHPDADVPSPAVAYHSGGLYEVLLGLALLAVVWPLRHRLQRPTTAMWLVIGLLGAGRFAEFFYRSDSQTVALGLSSAQWTSLGLVAAALAGTLAVTRRPLADSRPAPHEA